MKRQRLAYQLFMNKHWELQNICLTSHTGENNRKQGKGLQYQADVNKAVGLNAKQRQE